MLHSLDSLSFRNQMNFSVEKKTYDSLGFACQEEAEALSLMLLLPIESCLIMHGRYISEISLTLGLSSSLQVLLWLVRL